MTCGGSPTVLNKNIDSKHFNPIDLKAGKRNRSFAKRPGWSGYFCFAFNGFKLLSMSNHRLWVILYVWVIHKVSNLEPSRKSQEMHKLFLSVLPPNESLVIALYPDYIILLLSNIQVQFDRAKKGVVDLPKYFDAPKNCD